MKRAAVIVALLVVGFGLLGQLRQQPAVAHNLVMAPVGTLPLTVRQLTAAADIIAVVRPTGNDHVHWNSAQNRQWVPTDERQAMIYNDQELTVVRLLRGEAADSIIVRNIGGTVGDSSFEYEGLEALDPAHLYVVFLETVETPTEEGAETALSFVGQGQGVFVDTQDAYVSVFGQEVVPADI